MKLRSNCFGMFRTIVALVSGQTAGNRPNKKLGNAARFLLPCLLAIAFGVFPDTASAEGQCPPGMFQTVSRDYIACAPIPGYNQGGDDGQGPDDSPFRAPNRPTVPIKPGYMAAAHHLDTSSVWMVAGHKTLDAAKKRALDGCNSATGGRCVIADTLSEFGLMYVAEDAMGLTWIKGATRAEINKSTTSVIEWNAAIDLCWRNSFGCKFLGYIQTGSMPVKDDPATDYSEDHFPKGSLTWNRWAMVARPEKAPTAELQSKSWLSTGKKIWAAARTELLDRCRADSGVPCTITSVAANGVLAHFVDATGQNGWISAVQEAASKQKSKAKKGTGPNAITTKERVDSLCPPAAKPCRVIAAYDAATPRMQVVKDVK